MALSIDASTSRTCRLRNATPERLAELIGANLADLLCVLEFNVERGVLLYRISSHLIPFASHPVNDRPWWDDFAGPLSRIADVIARSGMRVSVHPGQFTVLNSPNPKTVADSLRELEWHARLLDALRTDTSSSRLGKVKTITQIAAVFLLTALNRGNPGALAILYVAVALTVISGYLYFVDALRGRATVPWR